MIRTVRAAAAACLALGVVFAVGCSGQRTSVQDRFSNHNTNYMWPEKYAYQAREPVLHSFEQQALNAAVVDEVVNNSYFELGSEKLNPVGQTKLNQLARKVPQPNPTIWLQMSNDVAFDAANPSKTAMARQELDQKRAQTILGYLASRPNPRGTNFTVEPIDIDDPGLNSAGPATSVRGLTAQYKSSILGLSGATVTGAGGAQATSTVGVAPTAGNAPTGGNPPPR